MSKQDTIKKIIAFFEDNEELFNACIEELDGYNGFLGDDRYYNMGELNEFYNGTEPIEILYRAFYGRDDDNYHTDAHGDREYGAFNPNRDYFYFDGYGNFCSTDWKDYSDKLDEYTIQEMSDNRQDIDSIEEDAELSALFDELEQNDEAEGEQ